MFLFFGYFEAFDSYMVYFYKKTCINTNSKNLQEFQCISLSANPNILKTFFIWLWLFKSFLFESSLWNIFFWKNSWKICVIIDLWQIEFRTIPIILIFEHFNNFYGLWFFNYLFFQAYLCLKQILIHYSSHT